jgi:hypothetical protein
MATNDTAARTQTFQQAPEMLFNRTYDAEEAIQ